MAKYKVDLIEPGAEAANVGSGIEITEEELRESVEILEGVPVKDDKYPKNTIGEVTDARYNGGVECTVEIHDEDTIDKLDEGMGQIAPVIAYHHSRNKPDKYIMETFAVANADPLVGNVERIEKEYLYWEK